jgi:hypothetical protein
LCIENIHNYFIYKKKYYFFAFFTHGSLKKPVHIGTAGSRSVLQHLELFLITFRRLIGSPLQNANLTRTKTENTPQCSAHSARRFRLPMETGGVPQPGVTD